MSSIIDEVNSELERCKNAREKVDKTNQKISNALCWLYFSIGCLVGCTVSFLLFGVVTFWTTCNWEAPAKSRPASVHAGQGVKSALHPSFNIEMGRDCSRLEKLTVTVRSVRNAMNKGA